MGNWRSFWGTFLILVIVGVVGVNNKNWVNGALVPALFIFGDSVVDVGNNNKLFTIIKANFPPYGRDFSNHTPTGRFCNGKLAVDFVAETLGFSSYPMPYPGHNSSETNLLIGANFASGGSGFYDATANIYHTVSLSKQLENYKEYQGKLVKMVGKANASSIISGAIYIVSSGSSDFIQNYYINPLVKLRYTPDSFSDMLLRSYSHFIQGLYDLGARRIGATSLPPLGCLPATITLFGRGKNDCVAKFNNAAVSYNGKLNTTSIDLQKHLKGLKLVVFDIYEPLYKLVTKPGDSGFGEARKACCGTGLVETSFLCNSKSMGTCANATAYVFWDGFHPSEAANEILSDGLITAGISLIS